MFAHGANHAAGADGLAVFAWLVASFAAGLGAAVAARRGGIFARRQPTE